MELQPHKSSSDSQPSKRKRTHFYEVHNSINDLPDDVLVEILSRLPNSSEATRTSLLSRRWRCLWRSLTAGTLELDNRDMFSDAGIPKSGKTTLSKKIIARVNHTLKSHRHLPHDGLIIRFAHLRSLCPLRLRCKRNIDNWIRFAAQREVKALELSFSMHIRNYEFPSCDLYYKLGSFASLRTLTLTGVDIQDRVVHNLLAECPFLQRLCIRGSRRTENLRVFGLLRNLKTLEISKCRNITSLQVSATNLVSCTYRGKVIELPFKDTPNLSELTLGGDFARSFIYEPHKNHSTYSEQLVKLTLDVEKFKLSNSPALPLISSLKHLELNIKPSLRHLKLNFGMFISLIKAAPLLNEFRFKMFYTFGGPWRLGVEYGDPRLRDVCHKNLKEFKMSGYVGCSSDNILVQHLLEIAPSIETVTIDTEINYPKKELWHTGTGAETRIEAIERAKKLSSSFPPNTLLFVT